MKIQMKFILFGFIFIALVMAIVGVLGINSAQKIQDSFRVVSNFQNVALSLINTKNSKEFNVLRADFDKAKKDILVSFENSKNSKSLVLVSDAMLSQQEERLNQRKIFEEQYPLEKQARYDIRTPLFALNNASLNIDVGYIQYYSKEALYQEPNQKNLDSWLASIDKVKNNSIVTDEKVLAQLDSYKIIAKTMGDIAITEERIKREMYSKTEAMLGEISKIVSESQVSAKVQRDIVIVGTLISVLASIGMGIIVSRKIAKPILSLRNAADDLARGNLDTEIKVNSKDEIGDLAKSLDKMRLSLKIVMDEYKKK
ncbi:MAG: HAMP domain-containing protein [Patescibacteria group bacterium]